MLQKLLFIKIRNTLMRGISIVGHVVSGI
jgi:hypothetical protein